MDNGRKCARQNKCDQDDESRLGGSSDVVLSRSLSPGRRQRKNDDEVSRGEVELFSRPVTCHSAALA